MNYKLFLSYIAVVLALFFFNKELLAQHVKPDRWFVSAEGGVSVFFGDVKRYEYIPDIESPSEIQPMFSLNFGKEISPIISVRSQLLFGGLSGHKKSAKYNFESSVYGGHIIADFNLIYLLTKQRFGNSRFNVNIGLGLGYLAWDSKLYSDYLLPDGSDLIAENASGAFSIPGALNIEYLITKNISVGITGNLFVVTSDEVDVKPGGIKVDMINYNSIGIVYRFESKNKASKRKMKYRLDPHLYEPISKDKPKVQGDLVEETVVIEEGEKTNKNASSDSETEKINNSPNKESTKQISVEETLLANEIVKEQEEDKIVNEEPKPVKKPRHFKINHDLEEEAIKKETWASKEDNIWEGIVFSVQIAATKTPWDLEELKEALGVNSKIFERFDGSWYRYSVGHFNKMWRAKELRNSIRSKNGIEDAFIVVYRGDKSISLEEALNYAARQQTVVLLSGVEEVGEEENEERVYPLIRLDNSIPQEGLIIGIQILSMKNDHYPIGVLSGIYGIEKPIIVNKNRDWNKLIVSGFNSYDEALDYQEYARSKGFIDAFVVAFKDGQRISIATLKSLNSGQ